MGRRSNSIYALVQDVSMSSQHVNAFYEKLSQDEVFRDRIKNVEYKIFFGKHNYCPFSLLRELDHELPSYKLCRLGNHPQM
jgi:Nif11 domain